MRGRAARRGVRTAAWAGAPTGAWTRALTGAPFPARVLVALLFASFLPAAAGAQETHVVLVTGIGGTEAYSEDFRSWAERLRRAAVDAGVAPERVVWLGEDPGSGPAAVDARSTRENVGAALRRIAESAGPDDRVLLVLIGHGTARGDEVRFNLPGPDVGPGDVAGWLDAFETQTVAVVSTAPGSGGFVEPLAGPGRVVVTATRSPRELNETRFGDFFSAAYESGEADLDKDGRVSLAEAFTHASGEVERSYEEDNLLLVEHAVMEDPSDLAGRFWLAPVRGVARGAEPDTVDDPALRALLRERAELEERVARLRTRKDEMAEEAYRDALEELLVELALKNREIRARGGG